MQQRKEQEVELMTRLQQEFAEMMQEPQSGLFRRDVVFATWDLWQFGAFAAGLVLLFGLFWMATEQDFDECDSSSGLSSSSSEEEGEGEEQEAVGAVHWLSPEQQLDCPGRRALETFYQQHLWGPVQDVAHTCKLGTGGELPARHGRVHAKLECMCEREQLLGDVLCFQHHSQIRVRRYQRPGLLHTLRTGFYLDVEKTARWFQLCVRNAWDMIAAEQNCQLTVLPSSHSCKLQLTCDSGRTMHTEIMLGVQQDNSGLFMGSQEAEAGLSSSTTWLESCALQELLFFRFMARQAPQGSCHLTCLQLLTYLLEDSVLSSVHLKTVTMHLLTLLPPSAWCPEHLLERLRDVLRYLHRCLEEKQLHHFLLGNKRVPREVPLPAAFQTASPLNLFQHLAQQPDAHAQALREFTELQDRLRRLLLW
ncbi:inositol 1,4,5-trisphosphate receptor-interacting protein-like 1, partial [Dromaius novaehollandiae]|uniref:inositol 1,4,5-trisphosphate receptor-interacting protein-like 1 n=1 Tax=Dromaius novaehollandiae TaxID=8790 RepID=UPI00311EC571